MLLAQSSFLFSGTENATSTVSLKAESEVAENVAFVIFVLITQLVISGKTTETRSPI